MNDFRFAKWPDGMDDRTNDVAEYCDALNDVNGAWERFLSEIEQNPGDGSRRSRTSLPTSNSFRKNACYSIRIFRKRAGVYI